MENKIYVVIFHVKRAVLNRHFTSEDKAMAFVRSLRDEPKVDLNRGIYVHEEPIDMEETFHVPKGGRDPQPNAVEVIFTETGMTTRSMNELWGECK